MFFVIIPLIKAHLLFMESEHKRDVNSQKTHLKIQMNIQGKWISVFAQLYWDTQLLNVSLMGAFVIVLEASITNAGWFLTASYQSLCKIPS